MRVEVKVVKTRVIELDAQTLEEIPKKFEEWNKLNVFDDGSRDDVREHTYYTALNS